MLWSYTVQWTLIQVWCLRHYFSSLKGTGQLLMHPDFYWYNQELETNSLLGHGFRSSKYIQMQQSACLCLRRPHRCLLMSQIGIRHLRTPFTTCLCYLPSRSLCFQPSKQNIIIYCPWVFIVCDAEGLISFSYKVQNIWRILHLHSMVSISFLFSCESNLKCWL